MEDNLNLSQMEEDLNFSTKGKQPKFFQEEDIQFFVNLRRPQ
jgi:hypothetical protein